MATFRCLKSNNTVTFTQQVDIDSMRGHQGYVLVDEDGEVVKIEAEHRALPMSAPTKKLGRPKKVANVRN
jgi:hypothetical protein